MRQTTILTCLALVSGTCMAVTVVPSSYDMVNGSFFLDDTYSGTGCRTCNGAVLTGGLGDLSDNVIASSSFNVSGAPYVGWQSVNPTVTFNFAAGTVIDSVSISVDDTGGVSGVRPPSSVIIAGTSYAVPDPAGVAPFTFTVNNVGFVGSSLPITFVQSGTWVMVSEVAFSSAVPEVAAWVQLLMGGLGLAIYSRSRMRGMRKFTLRGSV